MEQIENLLQSDFISNQTFEDFFECNCNILARSSALAVAKYTGDAAINPFLILGDEGIGKTSLLQAMISEIQKVYPHKKVIYQTVFEIRNFQNYCQATINSGQQSRIEIFIDAYAFINSHNNLLFSYQE